MAIKTFAAIDVGSFEMAMKIFEISGKTGMKEIDHIRHRLALGTDSYSTRKISYDKMEELCRVLREFQEIMAGYHVNAYQAYGTSAIRETENTTIILDQIRNRTGINLEVLSNSEQRFLDYKSIASQGEMFHKIIEKGTAIVDIGGGNIQLSLFDEQSLVTTQNLKLGVLRIHERIVAMQPRVDQIGGILDEIINSQLRVFEKMYMQDRQITNLIIMDDYVSGKMKEAVENVSKEGTVLAEDFVAFTQSLMMRSPEEIAEKLAIPEENVDLLSISSNIITRIVSLMKAKVIWAPGVTLCDGIAYEYAEKRRMKIIAHDFEEDILACAGNISHRYQGNKVRSEMMEEIALAVFDNMKEYHGMGKRERLLLRLAAILHDCGKFINMTNVGECSYHIVMNTEIIGISHLEREMVAYVVRFIYDSFVYYDEISASAIMDRSSYLIIAKLTAILRIANALDKSQKQKFRKLKAQVKEQQLLLTVDAAQNIILEREQFRLQADFFEEVYCIQPVIVPKKM
ncbi:MAG TPA: exopolyphosphatase [Lachnospiraceae bacterium]|nr:exopolyphosphatase [Lachnospiraceae bacterium]